MWAERAAMLVGVTGRSRQLPHALFALFGNSSNSGALAIFLCAICAVLSAARSFSAAALGLPSAASLPRSVVCCEGAYLNSGNICLPGFTLGSSLFLSVLSRD
jgi:hypothetical protein